jgi:hypothetical protein
VLDLAADAAALLVRLATLFVALVALFATLLAACVLFLASLRLSSALFFTTLVADERPLPPERERLLLGLVASVICGLTIVEARFEIVLTALLATSEA